MLISPWYLRKCIYNITYTTEIHLFVLCFFLTWFPQLYQMKIAIGYNILIALAFSIPVFLLRMEFPVTYYGVQSRETSPKKVFLLQTTFQPFWTYISRQFTWFCFPFCFHTTKLALETYGVDILWLFQSSY